MFKGIYGKPYIDLSSFINVSEFDKLHPAICRSFAIARHHAALGSLDVPDGFMNLSIYDNQFKPLYKAYEEFLKLSETDPLKIYGLPLQNNDLSIYLKYALGGYDLYSFYVLYDFNNGWRDDHESRGKQPCANYFPEVIDWIDSLVKQNIFSHIGRASFFAQESGGISFEHRDPSIDPEYPEMTSEFIHFRPTLDRPFYVRGSDGNKVYIDSRAAYWNDQDWHGGDVIQKPTYSLRIDGLFAEEFKNKILEQNVRSK